MISQKLFWEVYNLLNSEDKELCFFKELNDEWFINDGENFFFCDFKYKNKIIEYDGIYWYKDINKDIIRNGVYEKMGYQILIINENDYSQLNQNINTVNKCVNFLLNEGK
jgi:hypothetical protein